MAEAHAHTVKAELDRATVLWTQAKDDLQSERRHLAEERGRVQRETRVREAIHCWTLVAFLFAAGAVAGWLVCDRGMIG